MTLERALEKLAEANTLNAELLAALEQCLTLVELDELTLGFAFDQGRTARAAIAKARGTG